MAKNKGVRIVITLECTECRSNPAKRSPGVSADREEPPEHHRQLEIKKFCPHCNKSTVTKRSSSSSLLTLQPFLIHVSSFFKKRLSPIKPGDPIDYKDVDLLKKFITERGKILPRRLTGLTAKQQRDLTNAVKRARIVALLPFVNPEG